MPGRARSATSGDAGRSDALLQRAERSAEGADRARRGRGGRSREGRAPASCAPRAPPAPRLAALRGACGAAPPSSRRQRGGGRGCDLAAAVLRPPAAGRPRRGALNRSPARRPREAQLNSPALRVRSSEVPPAPALCDAGARRRLPAYHASSLLETRLLTRGHRTAPAPAPPSIRGEGPAPHSAPRPSAPQRPGSSSRPGAPSSPAGLAPRARPPGLDRVQPGRAAPARRRRQGEASIARPGPIRALPWYLPRPKRP
eukprot:tig00020563_g11311.t1